MDVRALGAEIEMTPAKARARYVRFRYPVSYPCWAHAILAVT